MTNQIKHENLNYGKVVRILSDFFSINSTKENIYSKTKLLNKNK